MLARTARKRTSVFIPSAAPLVRSFWSSQRAQTPPQSETSAVEEHDIVVIGGGPAGLTLAAALASSEAISATNKITLIEGSKLEPVRQWSLPGDKWSNRVSSVTADNIKFLTEIGVWQRLEHARTRPIEEMQVWDGISDSRITFNSPFVPPDPWAQDTLATTSFAQSRIAPMATLVENLNLQRGAIKAIDQSGKVEMVDGSKVAGIEPGQGDWPVVKLESGSGVKARNLRARVLIGADGFNSPVKTYSRIESFGWAYDAHGVVATLQVSPSNSGEGMTTAWQRFLPEGPIAFLPLSDTAASLVWSTTPALASALKSVPLDALPHLINAAFTLPYPSLLTIFTALRNDPTASTESIVNLIESLRPPLAFNPDDIPAPLPPTVSSIQESTVASFPLRLSHADSYLGLPRNGKDLRTVLVGDAAHTVHPLAGQGLNMGLADVRDLVKTMESIVRDGGDVGSFNALKTYPRSRYFANHLLLSATDHLASIYGSQSKPLVWARSNGLEIINELESVKGLIMGQAGAGGKERSAGLWGAVASAVEGVSSAAGIVRGVGGMVGSVLAQNLRAGTARKS